MGSQSSRRGPKPLRVRSIAGLVFSGIQNAGSVLPQNILRYFHKHVQSMPMPLAGKWYPQVKAIQPRASSFANIAVDSHIRSEVPRSGRCKGQAVTDSLNGNHLHHEQQAVATNSTLRFTVMHGRPLSRLFWTIVKTVYGAMMLLV